MRATLVKCKSDRGHDRIMGVRVTNKFRQETVVVFTLGANDNNKTVVMLLCFEFYFLSLCLFFKKIKIPSRSKLVAQCKIAQFK